MYNLLTTKLFIFELPVSIVCFLKNRMFLSVLNLCDCLDIDKYIKVYSYIGLKPLKARLLKTKFRIFWCLSENTPKHFFYFNKWHIAYHYIGNAFSAIYIWYIRTFIYSSFKFDIFFRFVIFSLSFRHWWPFVQRPFLSSVLSWRSSPSHSSSNS